MWQIILPCMRWFSDKNFHNFSKKLSHVIKWRHVRSIRGSGVRANQETSEISLIWLKISWKGPRTNLISANYGKNSQGQLKLIWREITWGRFLPRKKAWIDRVWDQKVSSKIWKPEKSNHENVESFVVTFHVRKSFVHEYFEYQHTVWTNSAI